MGTNSDRSGNYIYYIYIIIHIVKTFYINSIFKSASKLFIFFILLRYNYLKYARICIYIVYTYTHETFTNSFSFNLYLSYFANT